MLIIGLLAVLVGIVVVAEVRRAWYYRNVPRRDPRDNYAPDVWKEPKK